MNPSIIPNQSAAASLTSEAKKIAAGKSKTRIKFNNTDNSALDVRAKTGKSRVFTYFAVKSGKYCAVNIDNQKVLLNVNSTAKRLHIAKNELLNESKNENFLEILSKKALETEKVLDNYNNLLKDHFLESKKTKAPLVHSSGNQTSLTREMVMKVVRVTLGKELGEGTAVESNLLIATHTKEGKVDFQWMEGEIGSGGNAKIFGVQGDKVYKWPNRDLINDPLHEVNIVKKLNENGAQDGISLPMHLIECIYPQSPETFGILMPRYENDYSAVCPTKEKPLESLNQEEILSIVSEFEKLLFGLAYMHTQGIVHGDIKPANILQKGDRTDMIDFGSARDVNADSSSAPSGETLPYTHINDLLAKTKLKASKDLIALAKAQDVFALGVTFNKRFNYGEPFKKEFNCRQDGIERNPLPDFVPQELVQLIEGMTHPDYSQRLTAESALVQLQTYKIN